ncbi:hypothetical protein [Taibaiella soli]|uniref:Uncharacterized protein n=1 Tax=Taibaiella soli TaxID=1649169 RepID=A0A2W2AZF5_9BACT|nr:hypothetical protein [Taibaiella soli]PZF73058.1 hypothetical protein DN068_09295 [Taibaiella soli]
MNKAFGIVLFISLAIIAIVMTWAMIMFPGQNDSIAIAFGAATFGAGVLNLLSGIILLLISIRRKPLRYYTYASFILALMMLLCGFLVIWKVAAQH